jgi:hypothetical protein
MSEEFSNCFKQTLRSPVPPTPAHFSKQFKYASKQEAGSMYCRIFQRALRSDNTKNKGEKMQALWEDRKHRDAFESYWSTKQSKHKKSMNSIDVSACYYFATFHPFNKTIHCQPPNTLLPIYHAVDSRHPDTLDGCRNDGWGCEVGGKICSFTEW